MTSGPGTKGDDDAYENSGQAFDADIDTIFGTEDAEVSQDDTSSVEEEETPEKETD